VPTDVRERLVRILDDQFGLPSAKDHWSFVQDMGMDSFDVTEFLAMVEEEFDVDIPDEAATPGTTLAEATATIERLLAGRST